MFITDADTPCKNNNPELWFAKGELEADRQGPGAVPHL